MRWILRDDSAHFERHSWTLSVSLTGIGPKVHLHSRCQPDLRLDLAVWPICREPSVVEPLALGDAYVRQNDLIAIYPEASPWSFGYQIDLRSIECDEEHETCLEVWLSVQTSLLDSYPQLAVKATNPSFEKLQSGLWVGSNQCFGFAVHPLDEADCQFGSPPSESEWNMKVFGRFMEKGVIRRMRFRLFAIERPQPVDFWQRRLTDFSDSPLPLTT